MRIEKITIENILGINSLDVALKKPVSYFFGHNGAGKSSIREAVKMALLGAPDRVALKKEYGELIHNGNKTGRVNVDLDGDNYAAFILPKGERTIADGLILTDMLHYCLEPKSFTALKADERRSTLFTLSGVKTDRNKVKARLAELGIYEGIIEQVMPILRGGFPSAASYAEEQRRDARAAWRAVTGEAYGEVKAEDWCAGDIKASDSKQVEITKLQATIDEQNKNVSEIRVRLGALNKELEISASTDVAALKDSAAKIPEIEALVEKQAESLVNRKRVLEEAISAADKSGLIHRLARYLSEALNAVGVEAIDGAKIALNEYIQQYGEIGDATSADVDIEKLKAEFGAVEFSYKGNLDKLANAKAAAKTLESINSLRSVADIQSDIDACSAESSKAIETYQFNTALLNELKATEQAINVAADNTRRAAAFHDQAKAWDAALKALSPDGIPSEILNEALHPFNARLKYFSECFEWPIVNINSEMIITANDMDYRLLSESEQWRADAVLALAISEASGTGIISLDRFDVLDIPSRGQLIDGLDRIAEMKLIDTALVMGTAKAKPDLSDFAQTEVFWVEKAEEVN